MSRLNKPIIIIGTGGHAKVLIDVLHLLRAKIICALTTDSSLWGGKIGGETILGGDDYLERYPPGGVILVNGVGSTGDLEQRIEVFRRFKQKGYLFASVVHPSAVIAHDVRLGEGVQVMAGSVVQPGCVICENTILNTRSSVDHDCRIGAHCHLSPGVTLSGYVSVGEGTHIGTGSVVIQHVDIGIHCLVAAGSVIVKSIVDGKKVKGVPAIEY